MVYLYQKLKELIGMVCTEYNLMRLRDTDNCIRKVLNNKERKELFGYSSVKDIYKNYTFEYIYDTLQNNLSSRRG